MEPPHGRLFHFVTGQFLRFVCEERRTPKGCRSVGRNQRKLKEVWFERKLNEVVQRTAGAPLSSTERKALSYWLERMSEVLSNAGRGEKGLVGRVETTMEVPVQPTVAELSGGGFIPRKNPAVSWPAQHQPGSSSCTVLHPCTAPPAPAQSGTMASSSTDAVARPTTGGGPRPRAPPGAVMLPGAAISSRDAVMLPGAAISSHDAGMTFSPNAPAVLPTEHAVGGGCGGSPVTSSSPVSAENVGSPASPAVPRDRLSSGGTFSRLSSGDDLDSLGDNGWRTTLQLKNSFLNYQEGEDPSVRQRKSKSVLPPPRSDDLLQDHDLARAITISRAKAKKRLMISRGEEEEATEEQMRI